MVQRRLPNGIGGNTHESSQFPVIGWSGQMGWLNRGLTTHLLHCNLHWLDVPERVLYTLSVWQSTVVRSRRHRSSCRTILQLSLKWPAPSICHPSAAASVWTLCLMNCELWLAEVVSKKAHEDFICRHLLLYAKHYIFLDYALYQFVVDSDTDINVFLSIVVLAKITGGYNVLKWLCMYVCMYVRMSVIKSE